MQTADFTIAEFLAWARTKPADERYTYLNNYGCALAQFLRQTGRAKRPLVGGWDWNDWHFFGLIPGRYHVIQDGLRGALVARSFGGLVASLEALLPAEPLSGTWTKADAYLTDIEDVARERVVS